MTRCKRPQCLGTPTDDLVIDGYCSIYCRDVDYSDQDAQMLFERLIFLSRLSEIAANEGLNYYYTDDHGTGATLPKTEVMPKKLLRTCFGVCLLVIALMLLAFNAL